MNVKKLARVLQPSRTGRRDREGRVCMTDNVQAADIALVKFSFTA